MTSYEFINPSDEIHFDAPSDEVAALAALVVANGKCGARRDHNGEAVIGIALFGGDGGYTERYGRTFEAGLTALASEVVTACHSFRLARKRSSLSDWCSYAHSVELKADAETVVSEDPTHVE